MCKEQSHKCIIRNPSPPRAFRTWKLLIYDCNVYCIPLVKSVDLIVPLRTTRRLRSILFWLFGLFAYKGVWLRWNTAYTKEFWLCGLFAFKGVWLRWNTAYKRFLTLQVVCQQRSLTPLKYRIQKSSDSAGCLPTKESDSADIPHAKEFWLRGKRFYSNTAVSSTPWNPTPWWAAKGKTGVSIMKILAKYAKEKQRSCVKLPLNCISFNRVRFP